MPAQGIKTCVAGYKHSSSLWFYFVENKLVGHSCITPETDDSQTVDEWLINHLLVIKATKHHLQKTENVLPYLTTVAGHRAVQAVKDYNTYELALAFTSHHAWQLANGAKILPSYGELAKVYADVYAVFLFRSNLELSSAMKTIDSMRG